MRDRIAKIDTAVDKQEAFTILNAEGRFTERADRIKTIELDLAKQLDNEILLLRLESELKSAEQELEQIQEKRGEITGDSFVLTELEDQIEKNKKNLESLKKDYGTELTALQKKITDLNKKLKKLNYSDADSQRLEYLKDEVKNLDKKRKDYTSLKGSLEEIIDNTSLITHLQEKNATLSQNLKADQESQSKLAPKVKQYIEYSEDWTKQMELIQEISNQKSSLETQLEMNKTQLTNLKKTKKRIKSQEDSITKLDKEIEVLQVLYDEVFHKKGIPLFAINKMLPHISKKASSILSDITEERFTNLRLIEVVSGRSYGFNIHVEDLGELRNASSYSGGEKTQINAAMRLAISEQLSEIPAESEGRRVVIQTLFIDEGDIGSLDPARSRPLFINKIFNLRDKFKKIILITQFPDVAERFERIIHVTSTPYGESQVIQ